jgi:hypothetical protein
MCLPDISWRHKPPLRLFVCRKVKRMCWPVMLTEYFDQLLVRLLQSRPMGSMHAI